MHYTYLLAVDAMYGNFNIFILPLLLLRLVHVNRVTSLFLGSNHNWSTDKRYIRQLEHVFAQRLGLSEAPNIDEKEVTYFDFLRQLHITSMDGNHGQLLSMFSGNRDLLDKVTRVQSHGLIDISLDQEHLHSARYSSLYFSDVEGVIRLQLVVHNSCIFGDESTQDSNTASAALSLEVIVYIVGGTNNATIHQRTLTPTRTASSSPTNASSWLHIDLTALILNHNRKHLAPRFHFQLLVRRPHHHSHEAVPLRVANCGRNLREASRASARFDPHVVAFYTDSQASRLFDTTHQQTKTPTPTSKPPRRYRRSYDINDADAVDMPSYMQLQARYERVCQRRRLLVDFALIGWTWIMAPLTFDAGFCDGECGWPLSDSFNTTSHAIVQLLVSLVGGGRQTAAAVPTVPPPACVPIELAKLPLMYLTPQNTVQLRTFSNMKVVSCGCR